MSTSLLQHTQSISGYQHHSYEYKPGVLIAHISKKRINFNAHFVGVLT